MIDVTVYTLPNCVQCESTKRMMKAEGIEFTEVALQDHPDKAKEFIEQGYKTAPIVTTDIKIWSGFRYEKIKSLAQYINSEKVHDSHYKKPLDSDIGEL